MKRILMGVAVVGVAVVAAFASTPARTSAATTKARTFQLELGKVGFDLPEGWSDHQDAVSLPLVLTGPVKDDQRPVLTVIPTGIEGKFDENIGETEYEYRMGRKSYLERMGGELLGFRDYKKGKLNGFEAHSMGVRYRMAGNDIAETTWFVNCQKKTYYLQSLSRDPASDAAVEGVAKTFRCE